MNFTALFPLVFAASALLTWLYLHFAWARGVMDIPNSRSSHKVPTPRGGGVSIIAVYTAGMLYTGSVLNIENNILFALLVCPLLVGLIGFVDDLVSVRARWRFLVHGIAVISGLAFVGELPLIPFAGFILDTGWWIGLPLFSLGIIWFLNLYNFMDGIDGIAASQAITMCLGAIVVLIYCGETQWLWLPLLVASAAGGFLVWNWSPAKVFMGDAASGFLGILLGMMAVVISVSGSMHFIAWLILGSVFIVDATFTLVRRALRGETIYEAHRSHAYQRASRKYGSHSRVTLAVAVINIAWLIPLALFSVLFSDLALFLWGLACLPLLALAYFFGAGLPDDCN